MTSRSARPLTRAHICRPFTLVPAPETYTKVACGFSSANTRAAAIG